MNRRPEYDPKRMGQNLKRLRQQYGYTVEQVREYIGIGTVHSVYKWERGECFPMLEDFFALAHLYHVDPSEILTGTPGIPTLTVECQVRDGWQSLCHTKRYVVCCRELVKNKETSI